MKTALAGDWLYKTNTAVLSYVLEHYGIYVLEHYQVLKSLIMSIKTSMHSTDNHPIGRKLPQRRYKWGIRYKVQYDIAEACFDFPSVEDGFSESRSILQSDTKENKYMRYLYICSSIPVRIKAHAVLVKCRIAVESLMILLKKKKKQILSYEPGSKTKVVWKDDQKT